MKFMQLFGIIAILVPHCLAASGGSNSELEQRAPSPAQADDAAPGVPGISKECNNHLKIRRVHGNCTPQGSRGIRRSAHNCLKAGGKYYYCFNTDTERGTCMDISVAKDRKYEHGECFV